MISIKILSIIVLLPITSFAQNNFKPGYIVAQKGDTIPGFIEYKKWNQNPTVISFKTYKSNPHIQTFTNKDISYFSVTDLAVYKRFAISMATHKTKFASQISNADTAANIVSVFLRVLEKGKYLALYLYQDESKTRFFIGEKPDYAPKELQYNENEGERPNLQTLYELASKYNAINDDMAKLFINSNFTKSSLIEIVKKINDTENR